MLAVRTWSRSSRKEGSECMSKAHSIEPSMPEGLPQQVSIEDVACALHKCGKEKDHVQAWQLHAYMCERGLDTHASLGNYLVHMLASVGSMQDARQVFDQLSCRNSWSWNSLITGYTNQGNSQSALELYQKMQDDDFVHLSGHTFVALLKACATLKDLRSGLHLHVKVAEMGLLENSIFIESILIDVYAKCGSLDKAQQVFDKSLCRDVVSWTALVTGHVEYGRCEDGLHCLEVMQVEGIFPNAATFISSLKACSIIGDLEKAQDIHAEIERMGILERNVFVGSALVDIYSKFGLLSLAQEMFDMLPSHDVVLWTALIAGYAENGQGEYALACFEQMQLEGVSPNPATFVCALKACASTKAAIKGQEIHAEIVRQGWLNGNLIVAGAVVDMYAKCNLLSEAQSVFDKHCARDVACWTALIAGYVDNGCDEEAITCFEQMQAAGTSPNAPTIVCLLKACGNIQDKDKCHKILDEVERQALLEKNPLVGSSVVDMHTKCGSLDMAQQVFDKLPVRDVVVWTALIEGYGRYGYDAEALNCLEHMQLEGITPNAVTLVCGLKACSCARTLESAQDLHVEIERQGLLENNLAVGNALINVYAKCGLLSIARSILDQLPDRDVVSWTTLMAGYIEHGYSKVALDCYEQMQSEAITPNSATFVCVLKACSTTGAMEKGEKVHDEIEKYGMREHDVVVGNMLVEVHAKHGLFAKAHQIFERLEERNVFSWNALIAGYSEPGLSEETLKYYKQMQHEGVLPNTSTLVCVLKVCGNIRARCKGEEVHSQMVASGLFEGDICIGGSLIDMYGKCGSPALAQGVFDKLLVRDVVLWTSLMAGYAHNGYFEEALKCFEHMQLEGIPPNAFTLACGLRLCGSVGASEKSQEMQSLIEREDLHGDVYVCSSLVGMYVKCGMLAKAQAAFDKLSKRDLVSWTSLMTGYSDNGHEEEALECFQEMRQEGVLPNALAVACALKACRKLGATECGRKLHTEIEKRGLLERDLVGNTLVSMYAKCNLLTETKKVFDRLPDQNLVAWNALMTGCVDIGEIESLFALLNNMLAMCIRPDAITFIIILTACSRTGQIQKSETIFDTMSKNHCIVPTLEHYTCVVYLLGRIGQIDKGLELVRRLPHCSDLVVWRSILGACEMWRNVEAGEHAFNLALCLDNQNVAARVPAHTDFREEAKFSNM